MKHTILYKDAGAYSCFPAIAKDTNGVLWVTFRRAGGFSLRAVQEGKYDHVDKGARIALLRSDDQGESWSSPAVFPAYDPERGEQDPSVQVLSDGTMMVNFFQWWVVPEEEKERLKFPARQQLDGSWADVEGPMIVRSRDGGQTWEEKPVVVPSAPLPRGGTSDAVIELPEGLLMMGIYGADYGDKVCRAYSVISHDGGTSWGEPALIAADPEHTISFEEPALCLLPDGSILAMIRSGIPGQYKYLHQAYSYDRGQTWTDLTETEMWGHPAHALLLSDGRLLCSYGYRREPFGIRAAVSDDLGRSWNMEAEIVLRDDGGTRDLGYPCSVELPDGKILTVYYIHTEDGIRHIAGTKWDL